MKNIDLELTSAEKLILKQKKISIKSLSDLAVDEIIAVLESVPQRSREIQALFEFQSIPSIGVRFAHDLMFLNYYRLDDIKQKKGSALLDEYEYKLGHRVDPCVEDQFRLVVEHANNPRSKKQWWDFTAERKVYRNEHGYPYNRPE